MQFDDRTFLFSASITMVILSIVLLSMRRSTLQTTHGLGIFASANFMGILGSSLIGLRGTIPFSLSYFSGNFTIMMSGFLYVFAVRAFDGKPSPRLFFFLAAIFCGVAMLGVDSFGSQAARIALTNGVLGAATLYSGALLASVGASARTLTFNRIFCSLGFLGGSIACLARTATVFNGETTELFSKTSTSAIFYLAASIMTSIFTLGFIMLVNQRTHDRLLYLATHDPLTGALTRGAFMEIARLAMAQSAADSKPLALFIADLDHFKRVNDSFGHQIGDQALRNFVQAAHESLRKTDVLARYGGEEFVVLLPDTNLTDAIGIAELLRSVTRSSVAPVELGSNPVTVSIGVASTGAQPTDVESLIALADNALYASKAHGRNRVSAAPVAHSEP